ncbi:MAG TPA: FtsQ-type POTRA domain-containing protein [Gaiellaceae bacterium]|nr:FtsQ-type POTRA domain-containing protein [Gaiellaceae bacterium]
MAAPARGRARARPKRPGARRRLLRNGRALAVAAGVLALAGGAYAAARETSVFAVRELDVVGGTPRARAEVRTALEPLLGESLVRVGSGEIERRIAPLADVVSVRFDRRFPHTLHVEVSAERPVLLLRRGADTWVVSARGRVVRELRSPRRSRLPRVWLGKGAEVAVGEILPRTQGGAAAAALAPLDPRALPSPVRTVRATGSELTLVLRSGLELRLGDLGDLRLKLAIARRILRALHADSSTAGYLDVSVPERPVFKPDNPQLYG